MTKKLRKLLVCVLISIVMSAIAGFLQYTKTLEKWELKLTNNFFTQNAPSENIVIVGVDHKSINTNTGLGIPQNWPRTYYAQTISNIAKDNPKVIGIDVIFHSPSNFINTATLDDILQNNQSDEAIKTLENFTEKPHPYDQILIDAITEAGNVILIKQANTNNDAETKKTLTATSETASLSDITKNALATGYNATFPSADDAVHTIPVGLFLNDIFSDTFAFAIAKNILGMTEQTPLPTLNRMGYGTSTLETTDTTLNIPLKNGFTLINYASLPYPDGYTMVPLVDVYNGTVPSGTFTDKIVLIGWIDQALKDQFPTPHLEATGNMMPGIEIHANVIQMLLEGNFLEEESPPLVALITFFYTLLIALCAAFLRMRWAPLYLAIFFIDYWFFAQYAFAYGLPGISDTSVVNGETIRHKMLFAIASPYLAMAITYITTLAYRYATEVKARLALKTAFSYYLAPAVVEKVAEKPEQVRLGGERRDMTFLFSDIHDFTPFSETRDPAEVAKTLNEYFTVMADCVFAEGGTLDKFEGDALMAFWGAPLAQPDHAKRAVRAALRMGIALKKLHAKWQTENRPLLYCRIGINSGEAIVGNMGSNRRFDYTAIGDNVNLAARLEQANKQFDSRLLISNDTYERIQKDAQATDLAKLPWKALGEITVKGKSKAIKVWTLPDLA